jgi:hypothetical protein
MEYKNAYNILVLKLEEKTSVGDRGVDGKIILN